MGDLADGTHLGVDQHIGLAVGRLARGEQGAEFCECVRSVQQRTVVLSADAFPDFFRRSPKTNHQGVSLEAGEIRGIDRQTTARGNHGTRARSEFQNQGGFLLAKGHLAFLGENLRNGFARARNQHVVRVEIGEV